VASIVQLVDGVVANRFEISSSGLCFGRTADNQIVIDDLAVSSQHARVTPLTAENGEVQYSLVDLDSTNGTFVNEQKIERQLLHHKDIIRVGWNSFTFINEDEVELEKTTKVKKSWIPGIYYSEDSK
jgi:pSer/pThr/pTyr-binding forkhead associated (FHA) protein